MSENWPGGDVLEEIEGWCQLLLDNAGRPLIICNIVNKMQEYVEATREQWC